MFNDVGLVEPCEFSFGRHGGDYLSLGRQYLIEICGGRRRPALRIGSLVEGNLLYLHSVSAANQIVDA